MHDQERCSRENVSFLMHNVIGSDDTGTFHARPQALIIIDGLPRKSSVSRPTVSPVIYLIYFARPRPGN